MPSPIQKKILKIIPSGLILGNLAFVAVFAQDQSQAQVTNTSLASSLQAGQEAMASKEEPAISQKEENLSEIQKQARIYREQGFKLQTLGNIDGAMSLYQKAVELDPSYPVVYNDLGVIFETKGLAVRAEESYLKAISLDPYCLSAYSNLASLYENKGDYNNASFYWYQRVKLGLELGLEDDPWAKRAKQRLEDIDLISGGSSEYGLIGFMEEVARLKNLQRLYNKELAKSYFEKASLSYNRHDYPLALKQAIDAQQLDPDNTEIQNFIEKVLLRSLSR